MEGGKKDSTRILRCKHCKRMTFAHEGPYGEDKCKLSPIENVEDLKRDDEIKNRKRAEKRKRNETLSEEHRNKVQKTASEKQEDVNNRMANEVKDLKRKIEYKKREKQNIIEE